MFDGAGRRLAKKTATLAGPVVGAGRCRLGGVLSDVCQMSSSMEKSSGRSRSSVPGRVPSAISAMSAISSASSALDPFADDFFWSFSDDDFLAGLLVAALRRASLIFSSSSEAS